MAVYASVVEKHVTRVTVFRSLKEAVRQNASAAGQMARASTNGIEAVMDVSVLRVGRHGILQT